MRDPQTGDDISAHQASLLDHLDEVDPMSMTDLAGHMGVTIATMSLAIDRLEDKGYVRRERDAKDGRRVLLRITDAGLRLREATSVLDPVRVEQVLAHLSPAERDQALKGLGLLARASSHHMKASKETGIRGKKRRTSKRGTSCPASAAGRRVRLQPDLKE